MSGVFEKSDCNQGSVRTVKELTIRERMIVGVVLRQVVDCMEFEEETGVFEDGCRFILSLEQEDMDSLVKAVKKI